MAGEQGGSRLFSAPQYKTVTGQGVVPGFEEIQGFQPAENKKQDR